MTEETKTFAVNTASSAWFTNRPPITNGGQRLDPSLDLFALPARRIRTERDGRREFTGFDPSPQSGAAFISGHHQNFFRGQ